MSKDNINNVVVRYMAQIPGTYVYAAPNISDLEKWPFQPKTDPLKEKDMKEKVEDMLEKLQTAKTTAKTTEPPSTPIILYTDLFKLIHLFQSFKLEFKVEYTQELIILILRDVLFFYFDKNQNFNFLKNKT